jgi:YbbR domain-containing protein
VEPGEISFEILPEDLSLPGGIKVTRLSPSTITLDVERIEKKKLNILPVLQGSPQTGYEVVSVKFAPDAVVVTGPPSALSNMDAIWTKPINVEKKTESFNQAVTLDLPGSLLNLDLKDKESVKVDVIIDQKIVTRSFDEISVKILNSSGKVQVNPEKVKVRLMGPVNSLEKVDKNKDLEVSLDVSDLSPGDYKRKLVLKKPKDLTLLEISPNNADVKIFGTTQGE